jgi:hypothetical protein
LPRGHRQKKKIQILSIISKTLVWKLGFYIINPIEKTIPPPHLWFYEIREKPTGKSIKAINP